jgi:hypothetical protein
VSGALAPPGTLIALAALIARRFTAMLGRALRVRWTFGVRRTLGVRRSRLALERGGPVRAAARRSAVLCLGPAPFASQVLGEAAALLIPRYFEAIARVLVLAAGTPVARPSLAAWRGCRFAPRGRFSPFLILRLP